MESFANVATLSDLSACFVLFLLRSPHFAKTDFNIGRELQSWSVEGTSFVLGEPGLVLRLAVSSNVVQRFLTERLTKGN